VSQGLRITTGMHLRIYNNQTEITRMRDSGYSEDEGKTPEMSAADRSE